MYTTLRLARIRPPFMLHVPMPILAFPHVFLFFISIIPLGLIVGTLTFVILYIPGDFALALCCACIVKIMNKDLLTHFSVFFIPLGPKIALVAYE